ncbi:hypothetical protein ABZ348_02370 [Streptomyces sp. NPDC005963]|uniref:hypothetical protein n=1 Tax=Streptomyces sp. NPDC005963 TaxID=3156721 RepID=UPI003409B232
MATDDWDLVQRYRAGDHEAARQLMGRHWQQLILLTLLKLGGNWHDAEDAAAEAFTALADDRGVKPIRSVGPWLRRVALNKAADKARSKTPQPMGEPDEPPADLPAGAEQVDGRLTTRDILQALDAQERRVMAVALDGETAGWPRLHQAQALDMELYKDYKPALRQARRQTKEALLLLHMLHPENKPCQGLLERCGVTPGQASSGPQLTPEGRRAGMEHIGACTDCPAKRKKVKDRHWVPGVVFAPSPELYDRVRNICDARHLESRSGKNRAQRNPGTRAQGTRTGSRPMKTRPGTQVDRWDASPLGTRSVRRLVKGVGAGVLAALLAIAIVDKGRVDISLPEMEILPGVKASASPGGTDEVRTNTGNVPTGEGNTVDGHNEHEKNDENSKNSENNNTANGGTNNGNTDNNSTGKSSTGGSTNKGNTNNGSTGGVSLEGGGVVASPEDTTDPSVSLAGISTSAVGQEVVGTGGSVMQTCGPDGTPTTYSVWVAASDPSGLQFVILYIQHPTDTWTYESSTGVADGDVVRFDIPAYRTTPKVQGTVQLQLFAMAKDTKGNHTDLDLGTLPLYECGEPG